MTAGVEVLIPIIDPPVLPDWMARCSVRFEPNANPADLGHELPAELQRAVPSRRLQFLAGRHCARRALATLGLGGLASVPRGPAGAPIWPDGAIGSITHTRQFASAAVAPRGRAEAVGLDSEEIPDAERARRLATGILTSAEQHVAATSGIDFAVWLVAAFSAKEALYKLLHPLVGTYFHYSAAAIQALDPTAGSFRIRLETPLSDRFGSGFTLSGGLAVSEGRVHTGLWLPA